MTLLPEHLLLRELIRCPSVTPKEGGALDLLEKHLSAIGFTCKRLPFGEGDKRVDNLFASWGQGKRHLGFAGHSDVVPAGDAKAWRFDPFEGGIEDEVIYGRGATDMKSGIASIVVAAGEFIASGADADSTKISLLITGDEEGDAVYGTAPVLEWLTKEGMMPDVFLLGEPTSVKAVGDTIKIGRRGSLSGELVVKGKQGHAAYPHLADNPMPRLFAMLNLLMDAELDKGNEHFEPSTAAITSIDTDNEARNVTPAYVTAKFNIRYNTEHTADELKKRIIKDFDSVGGEYDLKWVDGSVPFITEESPLADMIKKAIKNETNLTPELSTSGGTSDARFIHQYAPVVECGLVGASMHQVDEHTSLADVTTLKNIYRNILDLYFA